MSFLSAAFLIALPLVAVPIAIHLYRGRQRDVIMWGAMQFLASAVTKGRRMERIEELILMALRFAAVAALVLALAQPMIRSTWLGHTTEREVILVLDNSMSMSREIDGQSAGSLMKEHANETIDSLSNGDAVQILLAAGNEWATAEGISADSSGQRKLREIVDGVEPTLGTANLLECVQAAVHLQAPEQLTARRIVVFTDGQASSWKADSQGAWQQLAAERDAMDYPITFEVVDCGLEATEIDNLAVTGVRAQRSLVRPGEPVELAADVTNMGDVRSATTKVQWVVAGKPVADSELKALEPRAKSQVTASVRMKDPGIFAVSCRIESADQVPLDQEDSLIVEVADQLPILVVASEGNAGSDVNAAELLEAALGYKGKQAQTWHSVYRPDTITPAALASHALADYRAIIINNPGQLDRTAIDRLDSFVRAGGGLWVALGDATDKLQFNRDWYSDGDGLSPLELDSLAVIDKSDDVAATIHPPTRDHAATLQLANTTQLDIDEARIRQRWVFGERHAEGEAVSALLESGGGHPLVVERYVGQGRVLVQAFPIGLEWSNLPLLKSYVVMVHDWLGYVTAPTMARFNLTPGTSIVASAPADARDAEAELVTPRGRSVSLMAPDADVAPVYRYTQTWLPGTYRVRFTSGNKPAGETPFHVARDSKESDIKSLAEQDKKTLAATGLSFGDVVSETTASTAKETAPRREPFWGLLLAALVLLLAGELLLSGGLARQRHGLAVSAH